MKAFLLAVSILSLLIVPTVVAREYDEEGETDLYEDFGVRQERDWYEEEDGEEMELERQEFQLQQRRIEAEMQKHEMEMVAEKGRVEIENKRHMRQIEMEMELEQHRASVELEMRVVENDVKRQGVEFEHKHNMRQLDLEQQRIDLERGQKGKQHKGGGFFHLIFLISIVVHVLVAIWVYMDIKARKTGSGLWIAITLLAGLLGALVYAVVRLGETPKTE